MRRLMGLGFLVGLVLSASGCFMNLAVREPVMNLPDNKKVVEIDDELYLLDLDTNRIQKIDKKALVHSETVITTETPNDD